jgi:hypothetical protein
MTRDSNMNWSILMMGMAMGGGGFATQPPPDVVFSVTPRRGGMAGSITTVIDYKNAPGAARVEITIYESVRCLGLLVPVALDQDATKAELPKGCYGVNFVGLPRGCPVTHALVEVKDKDGIVMARKWLDGLHVIVP